MRISFYTCRICEALGYPGGNTKETGGKIRSMLTQDPNLGIMVREQKQREWLRCPSVYTKGREPKT